MSSSGVRSDSGLLRTRQARAAPRPSGLHPAAHPLSSLPSHPAALVRSPARFAMPGGAHENMKAWEPEEDHIIIEMVRRDGPKWTNIVKKLPGRTVRATRPAARRAASPRTRARAPPPTLLPRHSPPPLLPGARPAGAIGA